MLPSVAKVNTALTGGMGLNLRNAPSRTGGRLTLLPDGTRILVVGVARDNFDPNAKALWYQLRFRDVVGYSAADFLVLEPELTIPLPQLATIDPQRTNGQGLNLRAAPARTAARLATMPDNTPVPIAGAAREGFMIDGVLWYQVQFGAQRGYCLGDFLSTSSTIDTGVPKPRPNTGPFVGSWPVVFPQRVVTAPFNQSRPSFRSPIKAHEGIDLRAPNGAPVVAWADGRVVMTWQWDGVSKSGNHAYGNHVKLFHPALGLFSMYCHLQSFNVVKDQTVTQGEQLGLADNTGNSTGAHLHFMIIDPVNGLDGYVYKKVIDPTPHLPQPFTFV
jgi:murein DD-endopeptidase MepM/ murein hydrolase activator NlpD